MNYSDEELEKYKNDAYKRGLKDAIKFIKQLTYGCPYSNPFSYATHINMDYIEKIEEEIDNTEKLPEELGKWIGIISKQ